MASNIHYQFYFNILNRIKDLNANNNIRMYQLLIINLAILIPYYPRAIKSL